MKIHRLPPSSLVRHSAVSRWAAASLPAFLCALPATAASLSNDPPADSEQELEARVGELERTVDVLLEELERRDMPGLIKPMGESHHGLGPAASKVYEQANGVSVGGYGEFLFTDPSGGPATWDAYRAILYTGFKFDEHWLFNSEIEIEHASTGAHDDADEPIGEVSLEFGYVEYTADESFGVRSGLLLVPVGLVNELHEPITFLPASRSQTENRIIPTTWRENGLGVFGEAGDGLSWKAYVVNGLDGGDFGAKGLRSGRQKGAKAEAEDLAFVGRVDFEAAPGLVVGGSLYHGDSGQSGAPDLATTIAELHLTWEEGPWNLRALVARAMVDDADELNGGAAGVAEELEGQYLELGYDLFTDLFPVEGQSLSPFVRVESFDTQAELPSGQASAAGNDDTILTFGLAYQPIRNVIFKVDYEDWEDGTDRFNFLTGYVF